MNGWLPDIDFDGIGYLDEDAYKGMLEQVKNEVHSLFPGQINIAFSIACIGSLFYVYFV
ncbi:hypothetical protein MOE50_09350 [Bacillus inaquosorum]|uniref:hypothetical protein n=1 Tax=Bacillus inaquosorum TaxID=483913 RepID=UPI00228272AB|nr:hypothetical protein [Bacillus inaquosorum]MCY9009198.1 hypothetical protein [Bacillus inaquosorum]MCY9028611.1 hypothetical protein [Bacillus inaquosorum]MCY9037404.1 hypothetical protein [Bacillus inaquosorum]MCY9046267.1 hypothetical protein [Bacillus inaquosorum]MCY9079322.1 hypothetical protein [Bacillus inaquosorum]